MSAATPVYIALGANLGEPQAQLRNAIAAIAALDGFSLVAQSSLYRTEPLGPPGQPDYLNAVLCGRWAGTPLALLDALQALETAAGRRRGAERWSARVLDLDILLFGERRISDARLTVPHYAMHERDFVLYPLAEIAPDLEIPGRGSVRELLAALPDNRSIPEKIA
ncbi:2-amino-4-hydroxy-6-hydroxymethyldihydropteridine diphosphokinase [Granulosicoccaceae sp. 1_MG-2023]|nr:2-amino-4-hydroxy-6-hydroxymethyldihydropteridine diphosphokinase [Granulosicoccaceae sp. 1_MG-2023]